MTQDSKQQADFALPSSAKPLRVHTPGPWSVGGTFFLNGSDQRQNIWGPAAEGMQSGESICRGATPQDARRIVVCVNAHDALLEALEKINEWCCYATEENVEARLMALQQIGVHARAAIEKAQAQ